jgi:transposase
MPASYSEDLRRRVVDAVERREGSLRQIARRFVVSVSFVVRLMRRLRDVGSIEPKSYRRGRRPVLGPAELERLRELIREQPDATLAELRDRLGVACSLMAVSRALRRLKITRKKKAVHARQQDDPEVQRERREFREAAAELDARHLVFVDESGVNTAMTRTYGRAPAGERVRGTAPGRWRTITLICGLRSSGATAPMVFEGATDQAAFETYVKQVLAPRLYPGDVVVWDNLKSHESEEAIEAVEAAGARVVPLPPWSPDLTPIEEMFSKVKNVVRSIAARTTGAVYAAFASGSHEVTLEDIAGWFGDRATYAMQL